MAATVYAGAVPPEAYSVDVTPGTSGIDLSAVTAAVFKVQKSDGTTATWSATRSNQSLSTLTLTYQLTSSDVATPGVYVVYAALTVPTGTVRTQPRQLIVRGSYEVG